MTINISALTNLTINELDTSVILAPGDGFDLATMTATPNGLGFSQADNWNGTPPNSPALGDFLSFNVTSVNSNTDVITFTETTSDGGGGSDVSTTINSGTVIGYNNTDAILSLGSNQYIVIGDIDLSQFDGQANPPASLTFGTTGPSEFLGITVCFASGTRIACPQGDTAVGDAAVEDLRAGDLVTLADGGHAPIVWIGHRHIDCRRHPRPASVLPVLIAPGAFGDGAPRRPLLLSPEHAVFHDGVLIPVRLLVNGGTIRQVERDHVTYYHIELAEHELLLAEGLPVESFLAAAGNRSWFENGPAPAPRDLERPSVTWECRSRAQLVTTGPLLAAARRHVAARAVSLGVAPGLDNTTFPAGPSYTISKSLTPQFGVPC